MTIDKTEHPRGRTEVTITLEKGETYPVPLSAGKEFVGPGVIHYIEGEDGGIDIQALVSTARVRLKA